MRILYASTRPPYPFFLGGAARCAHELLVRLSMHQGVVCTAVGDAGFAHPPWNYPEQGSYRSLGVRETKIKGTRKIVDCGYPVEVLPDFEASLAILIDDFHPDVIWTQMEGAELVARKARDKGIPCVYFVHDAELPPEELKGLAKLGCGFVASSRFLAEKAGKVLRRNVPVIYPCPKLDFGVTGDRNGFVTMINPHRVKGVETFYRIAASLPQVRFLLLESWKLKESDLDDLNGRLSDLPNVEFRRRVSDMATIYRDTRLLIVPSVWEEGFGMVVVEAQSCGIPVIASNRGGLPEAVGRGGLCIDDYEDPNAWVDAINEILGNAESYRQYSESALMNAERDVFSCENSADVFHKALLDPESVLGGKNGLLHSISAFFRRLLR